VASGFLSSSTPTPSKYAFYAFGSNRNLLGDINIVTRPILVDVEHIFQDAEEEIIAASAGYDHSAVLIGKPGKDSHPRRLYAWGSNIQHQIMAHDEKDLPEDSTMDKLTLMNVNPDLQIVDIDLTGYITCALLSKASDDSYETKCWGEIYWDNSQRSWTVKVDKGQLQEGEKLIKIATSRHHITVLGDKGSCLSSGDNFFGQFGDGSQSELWQQDGYKRFAKADLEAYEKIVDIELGPYSTFYLTEGGKLLHSGRKSNKELFESTDWRDSTPVPVDDVKHLNIKHLSVADAFENARERIMLIVFQTDKGEVYSWNYDQPFRKLDIEQPNFKYSQIFAGSTNIISLIESTKDPEHVYVGTQGNNEYGVTEPEHVENRDKTHVWEWNKFEQYETPLFARIGTNHAVVMSKRRIWVWGDNAMSQCGRGHPPAVKTPKKLYEFDSPVKSIVASRPGALIVTESKELFSYGVNSYHLLAQPLKVLHTPRKVRPDFYELKGVQGDTSKVVAATASIGHSAIVTEDGLAFLVGKNEFCRLGNMSETDKPTYIHIPKKVIAAENGFFHNMFLSAPEKDSVFDPDGHGVVWTMGMNGLYQLGVPTIKRQSCEPVAVIFEKDQKKLLGPDETITHIAAGEFHNTIATSNNRVFSWGQDGDMKDGNLHKSPTLLQGLETLFLTKENIIKLSCGTDFTLIFTDKHRLVGFGSNVHGNLDGIADQKSAYNEPVDITEHMRSLGVLQPSEQVLDMAAAHFGSLVYTNHSRIVMFGFIFYDEEDREGVQLYSNTTFSSIQFKCPKLNMLGAGSSVGFIVCEEEQVEASLWEKYRVTIFIAAGLFGGVSIIAVAIAVVLGCGAIQKSMLALLHRGTKKGYKYGQLPDEDEDDPLWEDGHQVNVFDEDLIIAEDDEGQEHEEDDML